MPEWKEFEGCGGHMVALGFVPKLCLAWDYDKTLFIWDSEQRSKKIHLPSGCSYVALKQLVNPVKNIALMLTWQQVVQAPVTLELDLEDTQNLRMNYWAQGTIFWLNILS